MRKIMGLLCLLTPFLLSPFEAHAITAEEGFLYSAIGCTNAFKRSGQEDKTEAMINLVHAYSKAQGIHKTQPGYLTRFIKLVERKWGQDYEMAVKNCNGIYDMAIKESKPEIYNNVAKSVVQYMRDLEAKGKKKNIMVPPKQTQTND